MIILGVHPPDELIQIQLDHLAKDPSVLILTETTSNVSSQKFISNIDQLIFSLSEEELSELRPEVLITFGGMVVSKKIKQFLRRHQPDHHWHVDPNRAMDTYHCLEQHIPVTAQLFFSQFFFLTKTVESEYQAEWLTRKQNKKKRHREYLNGLEFSDFQVFYTVFRSLPQGIRLQLSNSSVIRYAQLFDLGEGLDVFCNRGTSGIDGSTSTAIGAAAAFSGQTVFITGDLSFFYDSNAFWNSYTPSNFRVIVVNNSGGGIFRILPGPKSSGALDYFETPHQLDASHLCEMHGIDYQRATDLKSLESALEGFFNSTSGPRLLEIFTPSEVNDRVLMDYFKFLDQA
jgi:2-succinyl-5-enolpyruvyl-6-hydroxy-3-cyclohexene-1-carboxylate synthase